MIWYEDECRTIQFKEKIAGMALINHVTKHKQVSDQGMCQVHCYYEPNCVSFNYGPQNEGSYLCELNNKSHLQVLDDLQPRDGFIYRPILINPCVSSPCANHSTCQAGFGEQGYRCVCYQGHHGPNCYLVEPPIGATCVNVTQLAPTTIFEVSTKGSSRGQGYKFCRVIPKDDINAGDPYTVQVDLFNMIGWRGVNSGHLGVMFNVIDENNFDLVFFRPHLDSQCYELGFVSNGAYASASISTCATGPPPGEVWFTVRVVVSLDKSVNIFLNDILVTSQTAHFDTRGRGGVAVLNGYMNIIRFREFSLTTAQ